jgi:hypothetical protein
VDAARTVPRVLIIARKDAGHRIQQARRIVEWRRSQKQIDFRPVPRPRAPTPKCNRRAGMASIVGVDSAAEVSSTGGALWASGACRDISRRKRNARRRERNY